LYSNPRILELFRIAILEPFSVEDTNELFLHHVESTVLSMRETTYEVTMIIALLQSR
jgi:hypothetical protein